MLADDGTYAVPKGRIFGSCLALGCVLIFFLGCVGARNSSRLCCFSRLCDFAFLLGTIVLCPFIDAWLVGLAGANKLRLTPPLGGAFLAVYGLFILALLAL